MSAVLDLPDADWDLLTLDGTWAREAEVPSGPLVPGPGSSGASAACRAPSTTRFVALRRPSTDEVPGEASG